MKDYYNILGVQPTASEDEIRSAYKKLAMKHHPDRGGDQEHFQAIQEAYSTLTDPERRAQWEQQKNFHQHGGNFNFSFNFGNGDIHDIFKQFHGNPFGQFRHMQQNKNIRTVIELDLVSTLEPQTQFIEIANRDGTKKTVQVNIPRGVQSGLQMRFPGHGDSAIPNVPPGDLYIDFKVRPSPGFTINNINLHKKTVINCIDAILGSKISILGLDNKTFELNIPPGTQPNTQFRIAQQGLWDVNHPIRGDLFVEIVIEIPRTITADQLQKLSQTI